MLDISEKVNLANWSSQVNTSILNSVCKNQQNQYPGRTPYLGQSLKHVPGKR